jgi:hypothetical protein
MDPQLISDDDLEEDMGMGPNEIAAFHALCGM